MNWYYKINCGIPRHGFASTCCFRSEKKASENDNERMTLLFRLHSAHVRWLRPVIGQISSLQATQMTQEAAIRDLDNERSRLKDKVLRLEEERESLQSQCQALEDRQNQQLLSLEKVCTRGRVRWNGHGVREKTGCNQKEMCRLLPCWTFDSSLGLNVLMKSEPFILLVWQKRKICSNQKFELMDYIRGFLHILARMWTRAGCFSLYEDLKFYILIIMADGFLPIL